METILSRISGALDKKNEACKPSSNNKGLSRKIYNIIKDAIINQDIPEGSVLPSTRLLATELKASRSTIIKAYELLQFEGYVEAWKGSGHRVIWKSNDNFQSNSSIILEFNYPEFSEVAKSFQKNVSLINTTHDKGISFRPGLPPLDIFPVNQWKNLSNLYWRYIKSSALTYSASSGTEQLKNTIVNYLNFSRNIKCDPSQIFIVSGSVQSLYIIGSVILNPGDYMTMENPTFPNIISIFKGLRANIQPITIDDQGIKVSDMNRPGSIHSKLVHVVPSNHYPTGIRMSYERRLELLEWANKSKTILIENDYEHEVNNYKDFIPSLYSLDKQQRTIFLGTFNRLLHPSIRVGYMVVPFYLIDAVEALIKHSHRFVPSSIQAVLSQFIENNYLFTHVKKLIDIAEERKTVFVDAFEESFGDSLSLNKTKIRSLHVLAELKNGTKDSDVVAHFAKSNIIAHAYSKCFLGETKKQGLIFGYSPVRPVVIKQKIIQMEKLFRGFY